MDRLMSHLLFMRGAVCAGTDLVANVVVVVGAVGAVGSMGAEDVVVTLLLTLFV